MLEQVAHYNDFTEEFRKKIQDRISSFGTKVKYRFNISHENPDPEKFNGKVIWPSIYTLDPIVVDILDNDEKRSGKSRSKKVGLVSQTDEKGIPIAFERIRVLGQNEGYLNLDLTKSEDIEKAAMIELHPKLEGGLFQDKNRVAIVFRVDEQKDAKDKRGVRNAKAKALQAAGNMTNDAIKKFAAAMNWDEDSDIEILRDKAEALAEEDPKMFNDLVESKKMEYQAVVKRALTNKIISYDPVSGRFLWATNQQVITVLGLGDGSQNEVERLGEFLKTGGKQAEEIYNKIRSLLKI